MNTPSEEVQLKQHSRSEARLDGMDLTGERDPSATKLPPVKEVSGSQAGEAFSDSKTSSRAREFCTHETRAFIDRQAN